MVATLIMLLFTWRMLIESARMGIPPRTLMWIGALNPLGHALSAWVAGRWVTPARAALASMGGVVLIACAGTVSLSTNSFVVFMAVSLTLGLGAGHFYLSLQLLAGHARPFRTLAWTLAFVLFGMGIGEMLGPFLCGALGTDAVRTIAAVSWGGVCLYGILAGSMQTLANSPSAGNTTHEIESTPALRTMARICTTIAMMLLAGTMSVLWPGLGVASELTDAQIARGAALVGAMMPIGALLWAVLRHAMRRPWLFLCLAAANGLAFSGLVAMQSYSHQLVALAALGISFSGLIFHCLYYANADDGDVAKSVGINEICFGLGAVAGPTLMGLLAWDDAAALRPYYAGGMLMLGGMLACGGVWIRSLRAAGHARHDKAVRRDSLHDM
jgi:hypothetical protein